MNLLRSKLRKEEWSKLDSKARARRLAHLKSPELIAKRTNSIKKAYASRKVRLACSERMKKLWGSAIFRIRRKNIMKGVYKNPDVIEAMRQGQLRSWADPITRKNRLSAGGLNSKVVIIVMLRVME